MCLQKINTDEHVQSSKMETVFDKYLLNTHMANEGKLWPLSALSSHYAQPSTVVVLNLTVGV